MNILGIDPGIANTGLAYRIGDTMGYRTIVTKPRKEIYFRIREVLFEIDRLTLHPWDLLVIEDFVGPLGRDTVFLIGAILGHLNAHTQILIHPKKWVKEFFGKKKDYKKAANAWCKRNKYTPGTQHEADSLCLLEWGKKYAVKQQQKS